MNMKILDPSIYHFMNNMAPYLNIWVALFFIITIYKITVTQINPQKKFSYGALFSELPGLPLTLLHTVCFVKGFILHDYVSVLLFAWWGPGFIITAIWALYIKMKKIAFDWTTIGYITSIACKVEYLIFMIIYYLFDCYSIMMAFSVWIIHDQINLAWFNNNADRTRRVLEDYWIVRLAYVGFLFIPFFSSDMPNRYFSLILGLSLFILWVLAIIKVIRSGNFYFRPGHQEFLRNIIYLTKRYRK